MHNYKKKFGQHFLYDKNIIQKIILKLQPKNNDYFIEIGPGEGALTNPLIEKTSKITLIEKDKDLIQLLKMSLLLYLKDLVVVIPSHLKLATKFLLRVLVSV